jgi:four helix bundle protein
MNVFREAYAAALEVSRVSKRLPPMEQYELARQMRRAARSIPANIVEGWGKRASTAEFKRYLQIAIGSCDETRMWLELSKDEGYLSVTDCQLLKDRYNRIGAMLGSLWKQWRSFAK